MKKIITTIFFLMISIAIKAQNNFQIDTIKTHAGNLQIFFIGHATLMFEFKGLIIHIDPVGRYADYTEMPKADLILITHQHGDHLDPKAIEQITKGGTKIYCNAASLPSLNAGTVLNNGDTATFKGIKIEAVPAYNIAHKNPGGQLFHPKGIGNGYVLTIGSIRIYIAGDTENIPEMRNLKNIDIAFLPMNLPYTMTPSMVADAVRMFNPKILYPYHYGNTDVNELLKLLKDKKDCEIRVRKMN